MPRVSVIMPSYNHAAFIKESIDSILSQTFDDFELIVVDDGSKDVSNTIISEIKDPRLHHIPLEFNVGACEAMNIALSNCTGEYIGVCNSDDIWEKHKLARQVATIEQMPEVAAIFSDVTWINDAGKSLEGHEAPHFSTIFAQANRSRFGWIRRLIEDGNCLCHPSVLIRRSVFQEVGNYDNYLRQLPDLDMWLRVVQRFDIHVLPDKLLRFRVHAKNTSKQDEVNRKRTWREHVLIANDFFRSVSPSNFYGAFGATNPTYLRSSCEKTLLREKAAYLTSAQCPFHELFHKIAIAILYEGKRCYGNDLISALDFQKLTAAVNDSVHEPVLQPKDGVLRRVLGDTIYQKMRLLNRKRKERRRMRKTQTS
ncbi:glycosyltransferase [Agrobacterium salinitolerans]|uniref:glycosyltransferase n=1 Tax=Agrobacterium salinitolerans TaxID=1183413 RepID=UPI001572B311|nr:glycosyltransferase [Agrobacterium salinitolerans]NTA39811.1 glycosyltransferase [Agrobacterium salinitolerans]